MFVLSERMMPTPRATVTQAEIRRCLKAARDAGFDEARVVIHKLDGSTLTVVAGKPSENADTGDDIDRMIEKVPNAIS